LFIVENGRYFKDTYVAHLDLPGDDSIIMLTGSRIMLVRSNNTFKVSWEVPFDDLQTISLEPNGISLVLMGDVDGPFIPVVGQS
jgi:vacuolar protein sorting-associated protein 13A/C